METQWEDYWRGEIDRMRKHLEAYKCGSMSLFLNGVDVSEQEMQVLSQTIANLEAFLAERQPPPVR